MRFFSLFGVLIFSLLCSCQTYVVNRIFYPAHESNEFVYSWSSDEDRLWYDQRRAAGQLTDEFLTNEKGLRLHALALRAQEPSDVVVLSLHGFGNEAVEQLFKYGKMFWEEGCNVFLPDQQSSGNSEGAMVGWGWLDKDDIPLWIDRIIELYGKDCKIILHGLSMGAASVILTLAGPLPVNVKGGITDACFSNMEDMMKSMLDSLFRSTDFTAAFVEKTRRNVIKKGGYDVRDINLVEYVKKIRLPILFIHSELDSVIPVWMMYELYLAKPEPKYYWRVRITKHSNIVYEFPEVYRQKTADFINKYAR